MSQADQPHPAPPTGSSGVSLTTWACFLGLATITQLAFKWAGTALETLEFGPKWIATAATSPAVGLAVVGYLAMFALWMHILQNAPLSRAFAMTGLVYVTVPAAAWLLFGEHIGVGHGIGILLIVAGVAVMGRPDGAPPPSTPVNR